MAIAVYSCSDSASNIRWPEPHQKLIEGCRKKHFDVIAIFFKLLGQKNATDVLSRNACSHKLCDQRIKVDWLL